MHSKRFVFVGDKFSVLHEMLDQSLDVVAAFCARNFCHGKPLQNPGFPVETIRGKRHLLSALRSLSFDILVSNGCPYILPVSNLAKPGQLFINVHGSLLPKFPGPHPIVGTMLAGHDGGATCHVMTDQVDAGAIISQVRVANTSELDLGLMFVLTNLAEVDAFALALKRDFVPDDQYLNRSAKDSYSKVTAENRRIDFSRTAESIKQHVRALGMYSQGAFFDHRGGRFVVYDADVSDNPFLMSRTADYADNEVAFIYDSTVVVKKEDQFLVLKNVNTDNGTVRVGQILA